MRGIMGRISSLFTLSTTMTGGKREMKRRVENISRGQRTLWYAAIAAAMVALVLAVAACSDAVGKGYEEKLLGYGAITTANRLRVRRLAAMLSFPGGLDGYKRETDINSGMLAIAFKAPDAEVMEYTGFERASLFGEQLALFALIDDLNWIQISIDSDQHSVILLQTNREWTQYLLGGSLSAYTETPEKLKTLLAMEPPEGEHRGYMLKRSKGDYSQYDELAYPMEAAAEDACDALIAECGEMEGMEVVFSSSALEEAGIPAEHYIITKVPQNVGSKAEYYVYMADGAPAAQAGLYGERAAISREAYNAIAELFEEK